MKRLVIITVGKTHSGKTTFARALEQELDHSLVIDQDNHAEFINTYYESLRPKKGPNTLKYAITNFIVEYAKEQTDVHIIICNSNRNQKGRAHLLEEVFDKKEFVRILVHFDIPDDILQARVTQSQRSTKIFRSATTFEAVLVRQQAETVSDPSEYEADHLFTIKDNTEVHSVIKRIIQISKHL